MAGEPYAGRSSKGEDTEVRLCRFPCTEDRVWLGPNLVGNFQGASPTACFVRPVMKNVNDNEIPLMCF